MYGSTAADALNNLYSRSGLDVKYYKDAACTQEIAAANMTLTEFSALTTVYAKATATEGYVIYTSTYEYAFGADVTDAYKLVFGAMMDSGYSYINSTNAEYGGITLHNDEDENRVITVNGETITFAEGESYKTYPVTAGQTYTVKYISTYAKADLNIFMMM